jgi:hypothetical protein
MGVVAEPSQPRATAVFTQQPGCLASAAEQHGCDAEEHTSVLSLQQMYAIVLPSHLILLPGQQRAPERPSARSTTR